MKNLTAIIALLALLNPLALAWIADDPPDGHVESAGNNADADVIAYTPATRTITSIMGTAHKGGVDESDADSKGIVYSIYVGWDRTRSAAIDAADEPPNSTTALNGGIDDAVTTITVTSTQRFYNEGLVLVDTELIKYTSKTETTLLGCTRGYNETTAAAHLTTATVTGKAGFELLTTIVCDGAPYHALGWDATTTTADDGTEGNLLQDGTTFTIQRNRSYIIKIRVIDGVGNTNNEVADVDTFYSFSSDCYVGENGDVTQGLEDDEVWQFYSGRSPAVAFK